MKRNRTSHPWLLFSAVILSSLVWQSQVISADEQSTGMEMVASEQVTTQGNSTPSGVVSNAEVSLEETRTVAEDAEVPYAVLANPTEAASASAVTSGTVAQPLTTESNAIIQVPPLWEANVKGEGTVVAIIDSGLDVEHDAFHLSDPSKAKVKSEEEMEKKMADAGITYGQWYNDKVIYGYNYADANQELKEADEGSHGTHVSGIAVGNPTQRHSSGDFIRGVAPEAQLMFMRVFSDATPGTNGFLYIRAIEDAVKLGADVINLSLGSATGTLHNIGHYLDEAIEQARQKGVSVVIAAGNDTVFGQGYALPDADKPDYGLVADPSVARGSISVASYNNTHLITEVATIVGMEDNETFRYGKVSFSRPTDGQATFPTDQTYEYEYVGLGTTNDLKDVDLTGKLALIKRGEITFAEKIRNAAAKNAAGVVIFNNVAGEASNFGMQLDDSRAAKVPAIFIGQEIGEELAKEASSHRYTISVDGSFQLMPNPDAGQMSEFTSWGLTADGELKPDVTAPGGSIYSSINDGKYGTESGTSMASPHVAGVVALLRQAFQTRFPSLEGADLEDLIKHVLMSTAVPHVNAETGAFTSPRQQGAGIVDALKASEADLYVTGRDDYGSVTLGNVDDTFTFQAIVHNVSDKDYHLRVETAVNTDQVADGKMTLKPRFLTKVDNGVIDVPAHGQTTVSIMVDTSDFTEELSSLMKNGYYLEGFTQFLDPTDGGEVISLPFVGFKGNFQDLPVLEKPIYEFKDGESPFYYPMPEDGNLAQGEASDYTALITAESEWDHIAGDYSMGKSITAGTFKDAQGRYLYEVDNQGQPYFAISPNGDVNRDTLAVRAVFLRNFRDFKVAVYNAEDRAFQNPLWESTTLSGDKNYYSGRDENLKSLILDDTVWDGKDRYGKTVADGKYVYRLTYYSAVPGAKEQSMEFPITVDTVAPAITSGVLDMEKRTFKPRPSIEEQTGIYRQQLYYVLEPRLDENGNTVDEGTDYDGQLTETHRVYIQPTEDGTYTLPETDLRGDALELYQFYFNVEDHAGNALNANLTEFASLGNESGIVTIRLVDQESGLPLDGVGYRYFIRDEEGNFVHEDSQSGEGIHQLPFGNYTVELLLYDEDYATLVGPDTLSFSVTEDKTLQAVDFQVHYIQYGNFRLAFDGPLPEGSRVYVVDQNGNHQELTPGTYDASVYESYLHLEPYTIEIELPRAYQASENDFRFTVLEGRNVKELHLTAKGDLTKDGEALTQEELPTFDLEADSDGDGFKNGEELLKGTDPMDASSRPQVTAKGEPVLLDPLPEAPVPSVEREDDPDIPLDPQENEESNTNETTTNEDKEKSPSPRPTPVEEPDHPQPGSQVGEPTTEDVTLLPLSNRPVEQVQTEPLSELGRDVAETTPQLQEITVVKKENAPTLPTTGDQESMLLWIYGLLGLTLSLPLLPKKDKK